MTALAFLVVLGLVFYAVWTYLARNRGPKAKLGPDGTNVREPETFVVHHEGKGQGLDIANTALKERTEDLRRDLPGDAHTIKAPIPGRDMIRMDSPPSDISRYGDVKVAPGPQEPAGPDGKGISVTGNHRDVELAEDIGPGDPASREGRPGNGRVVSFRTRLRKEPENEEIRFAPDAGWESEMSEEFDWKGLNEHPPLPAHYGEDLTMVLVRNPRSLYVYWERAGFGDENLRAMLGDDEYRRAVPCLRIFEGGRAWTIDVGEDDDHWFVNDGIEPGHEYVVSYERRTRDGRSFLLSRSWPTRTPYDSPAPDTVWDVTSGMLYQHYVSQPGEQKTHPGSQWR